MIYAKDCGRWQIMERMKMASDGTANLRPQNTRTKAEQREIARQGGIASGKARRQRKTLREIGDMIGGLDVKSEKAKKIMRDAGIEDEDMIQDVAMMFRLNLKAQSGDIRAAELVAKLRGQLKEQVQAEVAEVKPLVDLTKRPKNGEQA
jgi:hypothetical protein